MGQGDNQTGSHGQFGGQASTPNNIQAQLYSILRRRNSGGQCALDVAIEVQPEDGVSKTKLIAWLVDNQVCCACVSEASVHGMYLLLFDCTLVTRQADVTEDALDLIDDEIDDAERNIAERKQLAQRCSEAEELEITNDAFYQYVARITYHLTAWRSHPQFTSTCAPCFARLMSIGPDAQDRAVVQRARRREREAATRIQQWFRRLLCSAPSGRRNKSNLLVPWREAIADNGSVFYYNVSDKRTQWEPPARYGDSFLAPSHARTHGASFLTRHFARAGTCRWRTRRSTRRPRSSSLWRVTLLRSRFGPSPEPSTQKLWPQRRCTKARTCTRWCCASSWSS